MIKPPAISPIPKATKQYPLHSLLASVDKLGDSDDKII
jgi:hypothetical protein